MPQSSGANAAGALRGLYTQPQPDAPVAVREYLLCDVEGVHSLLLRWLKCTDLPVDSMTFEVIELDGDGEELGRSRVTHLGTDLPPMQTGKLFTPDRAIPVDGRCRDIRIRLLEITSGYYVYRMVQGNLTVDYDAPEAWTYDAAAGEREGLSDTVPLQVRSKWRLAPPKIGLLVAAVLVLLVLLITYPYISPILERLRMLLGLD